MNNPSILSVDPSAPVELEPPERPRPDLRPGSAMLDACRVGVVLRAVLFVEAVVAVATLFLAGSLGEWLLLAAIVTGGALPATLIWLLGACALKRPLARQPARWQFLAGLALGAMAALYGCGLLSLTGAVASAPWLASSLAGALLAGLMMAALA